MNIVEGEKQLEVIIPDQGLVCQEQGQKEPHVNKTKHCLGLYTTSVNTLTV